MKEDGISDSTDVEPFNVDAASCEESDFPEPERQQQIITNIDSECTCTYAVIRTWYKKWEDYCEGKGEKCSAIEMDVHNDVNNEYIHEDAWKYFVKWYGISVNHQLDRKHLYFKDEKMFDVCMLSPFSGIVEHNVKKFNRFEEIGYIECQLRKMFHTADYKKTRMWISEKAQVPRFRQLLLRFRMLNDCIHRDKVYILALEECVANDTWPTGEPGEPKGEMVKYAELMIGRKPDDYWTQEVTQSLNSLTITVSDNIKQMAEGFLQNANALVKEREDNIEKIRKKLEAKLEETTAKEKFLDEKAKQIARQEESLRLDKERVNKEEEEFEDRETKFEEELKQMENIHKIQESKIKLDIGGHNYTTSINTLRRDSESMLAAMFSGRHELKKESDGSYFIDRDGTYFRYILNFLRDGYIDAGTLPTDNVTLKELLREAKYYQLTALVTFLEEKLQALK